MSIYDEIKNLKKRVDEEIKKSLLDVEEHAKELELISDLTKRVKVDEFFQAVAQDALDDAKATIESAKKLIKASKLLARVK